jgi:hypothetical protein
LSGSGQFLFGNDDEKYITGGPTGVVASIASIIIRGRAVGTYAGGDYYGVVAEQIGLLNVGGVPLPFTRGPGNDSGYFVGYTPDFAIYEVTRAS